VFSFFYENKICNATNIGSAWAGAGRGGLPCVVRAAGRAARVDRGDVVDLSNSPARLISVFTENLEMHPVIADR